jgi:hypothetical protein
MQRQEIINIVSKDITTPLYSLFELITKEEGTELVHILEEKPLGSNNWLYVTKKDFQSCQGQIENQHMRVVNGRDIISLKVVRDSRSGRRKKL